MSHYYQNTVGEVARRHLHDQLFQMAKRIVDDQPWADADIVVDDMFDIRLTVGERTVCILQEPSGWTACENGDVIEGDDKGTVKDGVEWAVAYLARQ